MKGQTLHRIGLTCLVLGIVLVFAGIVGLVRERDAWKAKAETCGVP